MQYTKEELKKILKDHQKWLNHEADGKRAELKDADLRGAELTGVNLHNADLRFANLTGANLRGADLRGADLRNADLRYADIRCTNLDSIMLADANLYGVVSDKTFYQITGIGSREAVTTYCVEDDLVYCGCWCEYKGGSLEDFEQRVRSVYGQDGETPNSLYLTEYITAIKFFKAMKE